MCQTDPSFMLQMLPRCRPNELSYTVLTARGCSHGSYGQRRHREGGLCVRFHDVSLCPHLDPLYTLGRRKGD